MKNSETTDEPVGKDQYRLIVESATEGIMVIQNNLKLLMNSDVYNISLQSVMV